MYIIDKNKDFYDHYSHIYGIDKEIVFDRRGSKVVDNEFLERLAFDKLSRYYYRDDKYFMQLEIGYKQYLIEYTDFVLVKDQYGEDIWKSTSISIGRIFENHNHYGKTPISVSAVFIPYKFWKKYKKNGRFISEVLGYENENASYSEVVQKVYKTIDNPILKDTFIPSLLDGLEVWAEIQNYISSLNNDIDVSIPITDVEKAENHGFDKVTSFRHPVKF